MNKLELARQITRRFGFAHREANVMVEHVFTQMTQALAAGRRLELRGLGTFGTRHRKASLGRVVKTGKAVAVPALRRVFFRPGKELKAIDFPSA